MAPSTLIQPLRELADQWRTVTAAARRRAALSVVALWVVMALLVARSGKRYAHSGAVGAVAVLVLGGAGFTQIERRRFRDPRQVLGPASLVDPERASRARRALSLVGADGDVRSDGTSQELARMHVGAALADLPREPMAARARRLARGLGALALATAGCALGLGAVNAWSLIEGGDVLLARHGVAPVAITWLDSLEVGVRLPEYLHQEPISDAGLGPLLLPVGSLLTLRGVPIHPGRHLALSDGSEEVAFADDGAGAVVARWTLTGDRTLRVVARFGDVSIPEPTAIRISSVADDRPKVRLEGAPSTIRLVEATADIPIRYDASDDHGLREVQLVLRAGDREDRRVLVQLDGETKSDKGGRVLKLRDPFLTKSHVPIAITVEARDNDEVTGPKWGASEAITLLPPNVGEPESLCLDGLRAVLNAMVDTLAWRLDRPLSGDLATRRQFAIDDHNRQQADDRALNEALARVYGGVRLPSRVRSILVAQDQKMAKALALEEQRPTDASRAEVVHATERFVLVTDAVIRALGAQDARGAARQLADVAEDLAVGVTHMQSEDRDARTLGSQRSDAAVEVLSAGALLVSRLGTLGHDLGEIVDADLGRVRRARGARDLAHAELAARDLAARLHQPDPSFGAVGGSRLGGGDLGGGPESPVNGQEQDPADDVEQAFGEVQQDLERLAQEHAGSISKIEQAVASATTDEELQDMREKAKSHSQAIRDAMRKMPAVGVGSDSWTSKGAAARELAEQMARALEEARPDDALQSGRSSIGALDEAKKMLGHRNWWDDPTGEKARSVEEARHKLDGELAWVQSLLDQIREHAVARARSQLEQGGEEEAKLADRARELVHRGRATAAVPEQAVDAIDDAERSARAASDALKQGDAKRGLEKQRDAQRQLEAARDRLRGEEEEGQDEGPSSSDRSASTGQAGERDGADSTAPDHSNVAIPKPGANKRPEEFRRRVVRGLSQPSAGTMRDAVQRYAEGLLR